MTTTDMATDFNFARSSSPREPRALARGSSHARAGGRRGHRPVEASPLNPSDLGLLFGGADMTAATASARRPRPWSTRRSLRR